LLRTVEKETAALCAGGFGSWSPEQERLGKISLVAANKWSIQFVAARHLEKASWLLSGALWMMDGW